MSGWIKLHRQMLDWEWYDDVNVCRLFTHLLLKANHKDKCWKGLTVKAGSLVTGRHVLAHETGLSEQMIRTALNKLKSTGEITIRATKKYSIISLSCWDSYQDSNQQTNQQATNKQPTSNHKQECKNDKNDNNTPKRVRAKREDLTPYQQIVDCYHSKCTEQNQCNELTPARKKRIKQFWAMINKDGNGSIKIGRYFDYVASNTYLPTKRYADLHWLMQQDRYLEIKEGKFDND